MTNVISSYDADHGRMQLPPGELRSEVFSAVLRLDYLSCLLTVISTILVGKRYWEGWVLAGINSAIMCVIGVKTAQVGFIPANLFCMVLYGVNLRSWRKAETR